MLQVLKEYPFPVKLRLELKPGPNLLEHRLEGLFNFHDLVGRKVRFDYF